MDSELWNGVVEELLQIREGEIQIVDVGARILSMLDLFLYGGSKVGLKPLLDKSNQSVKINYIAYESNRALYKSCHGKLLSWGFSMNKKVSEEEFVCEADSVRLRTTLHSEGL
jgi:hypothetical protein